MTHFDFCELVGIPLSPRIYITSKVHVYIDP